MGLLSASKSSRAKSGGSAIFIAVILFIFVIAAALLFYVNEREQPTINLSPLPPLLSALKELQFEAADQKSGLRHVQVSVVQNNKSSVVVDKIFPRRGWIGQAGPREMVFTVTLDTVRLGLADGPAEVVINARDYSFWRFGAGNEIQVILPVEFDTHPPKVTKLDSPRYIKQGGSGIVTYKMDEDVPRHGVIINADFHPGFAVEGKDMYAAMIGLPFDTEKITSLYVLAEDVAGNQGKAPFGMIVKKRALKRDTIDIPDSFLELKIPEFSQYYPEMTGSNVEQYLYVNNKVRAENNIKFRELCSHSVPEKLWSGKFGRMPGAGKASFADHRTYMYKGKKIDNQVHLGNDIASVRQAPVKAANKGKVVYADYRGIYGNTVVLDHGTGVFSLYSHMSQISVAPGEIIAKNGLLGATGTTGMAGGDHLHYSMLVNGIMVDPLEWWDGSWLDLHIESYLK
ncbi:MAG: M23 family metallopeptidase [Proteobacteria bacterium]|nr:M23 family metallopeptidase [Pseudomonadota bacterium]MBU1641280.1 M23 family metallopeptidase [Pseudomonadota bacterium]